MLFSYSMNAKKIDFKKLPDYQYKITEGNLYIYGDIFFLYNDDGFTPQELCEERLISIVEKHKNKASLFIEGDFFMVVDYGNEKLFFCDFFGRFRAYYTCMDNNTYVSDNVKELKKSKSVANLFEEEVYARKGYTGRHFTTYDKIYRVVGGQYFSITEQDVKTYLVFEPGEVGVGSGTYLEFENIINTTFPYFFDKAKKNIIEFSGGLDSTFLALYAKVNNYDAELITGRLRNPSLDQNKYDIKRSLEKSFELNLPISFVDVDLSHITVKEKNNHDAVKNMMPFEKHPGTLHVKLATSLESRRDEIVAINGQNADSILCLGPSEKINLSLSIRGVLSGIKGMISRVLLSNWYCAFVNNRSSKSVDMLHNFFMKSRLRLPLDRESYILTNILFSKGYLPILTSGLPVTRDFIQYLHSNYYVPYKDFSMSEMLYLSKLQSFMHGGDHRIVLCSHEASRIDVALPYTTIALFRFSVNNKRSLGYIFKGKAVLETYMKKYMESFEKTVTPRDLNDIISS